MMNRLYKSSVFFLFLVVQALTAGLQASAAITFLCVDLKYNAEEGIKICEVQQGAISAFKGLNDDTESVARRTLDLLEQFGHSLWSIKWSMCEPIMMNEMVERHVQLKGSLKQVLLDSSFLEMAQQPLLNKDDITEYKILFLANPHNIRSVKAFNKKYPSVLVLDRDTYHAWNNKLIISEYFNSDPNLEQVKPRWKHYRKDLSDEKLLNSIYDFNTPLVVIKPVNAVLGRGVIILEREKLPEILNLIFRHPNKLAKHKDDSYRYWAQSSNKELIVEAFHSSDPIHCPHLQNKLFDGTMRVAFIMWRHEGKIEIDFITSGWKLPLRALSEKGTLNEKHKSYGKVPYFTPVDSEILLEVEEQLGKTMPILFQKMLDYNK